MKKTLVSKLRCAIYTRKSTEEGLDMEFNSLDAQREACSAYIASQRAEGWVELADQYDDGGFSGGNAGTARFEAAPCRHRGRSRRRGGRLQDRSA
jgi:DNA invertase Pin-like site-specific DNA recombinase